MNRVNLGTALIDWIAIPNRIFNHTEIHTRTEWFKVRAFLKKLPNLFSFILLFICFPTFADNLTATVDRDQIGLSETFILTLRYDEQINETPDYSLLQKDFEILNTQTGRQRSIVNGQVTSFTEWKLALAPKRIGKLLIPSFNLNGQYSDAIEITVEKQSPQASITGDEPVVVEIETDKDSAHVQEQIIFTVRLLTTVDLSGAQLDPLSIPDTFVTELDEKNFQTRINNKPGLVIEKRFAIFPQRSGTLTLPSLRYQVAVDNGDIWSRMSGNNQILRLMTDEKKIEIKPALDQQNWLPARQLNISEHWSAGIDNLKPGEPISRTITITAQGLTAAQIPPQTNPSIDGLTFYQDQAQTDDQKSKNGNLGSRIETVAIVPNKPGQYTLPEINIRWWNTETETFETATLAAVTLHVAGIASTHQEEKPEAEPTTTITDTPANINTPLHANITTQIPWWIYALLAATSLVSVILFLAWWSLRRQFNTYVLRKQQQLEQAQENEHQAWLRVKDALHNDRLIELRLAIIDWAKIHWKNERINSLDQIASLSRSSQLRGIFAQLDAALFGADASALDKSQLKEALANLRRGKVLRVDESVLKNLYPEA